jgi:transposase
MKFSASPEQLNREQLLELVNQLIAELEASRSENAKLRAELEQLKRGQARSAAAFSNNQRKQKPKRPGRIPGQGIFRHRTAPSEEDYSGPPVEVPVEDSACPKCGGALGEETEEIVTVTEIPPAPKPEVKAYRVKSRTCCHCAHQVRGRHPEVAAGQFGARAHRLGARAQAVIQILRHRDDIPVCKVPGVLETTTGLRVTKSAVTQSTLRHGTGDGAVAKEYQRLRQAAPSQETINTDDTGWRVGGQGAHLMVFESKEQTVYQIRRQHRNEEVREVIGDHYQGTLSTDRGRSYAAKELLEVKQQKCLGHILRSIDDVLKHRRGQAVRFGRQLKSLLQEAISLYHAFRDPNKTLPDYEKEVRRLDRRITDHLRNRALKDPDNQRLLNEIGVHHDRGNLLRFLDEPTTVEPTNTAAERALRPAVIARKVSHCSKNDRGAEAYAAFKSVIRSFLKKGANLVEELTRLLNPSNPLPDTASVVPSLSSI